MDIEEETELSQSSNSDIEFELEHLREYGNEKQLYLLRREISHIISHGLKPSEGWSELAAKFKEKDQYIYDSAFFILQLIYDLLEDRGSKPNFDIVNYYQLIHNVYNLWNYYKQAYGAGQEDSDILDLIEGIKFL